MRAHAPLITLAHRDAVVRHRDVRGVDHVLRKRCHPSASTSRPRVPVCLAHARVQFPCTARETTPRLGSQPRAKQEVSCSEHALLLYSSPASLAVCALVASLWFLPRASKSRLEGACPPPFWWALPWRMRIDVVEPWIGSGLTD